MSDEDEGRAAPALEWRREWACGVTLGGTWVPWGVIEGLLEAGEDGRVPAPAPVREALEAAGLALDCGREARSARHDRERLAEFAASVTLTAQPDGDGLPSALGRDGRLLRDIAVLREARGALARAYHPSRVGLEGARLSADSVTAADMCIALADHRLSRLAEEGK